MSEKKSVVRKNFRIGIGVASEAWNKKKFHFATMKKNFRVQQFPFFLNDEKQELKLLITVVAANWQPEEHY